METVLVKEKRIGEKETKMKEKLRRKEKDLRLKQEDIIIKDFKIRLEEIQKKTRRFFFSCDQFMTQLCKMYKYGFTPNKISIPTIGISMLCL